MKISPAALKATFFLYLTFMPFGIRRELSFDSGTVLMTVVLRIPAIVFMCEIYRRRSQGKSYSFTNVFQCSLKNMAVGAAAVTVFLLISIGTGLFPGRGNSGAAAEVFSGRAAELWILIILAWTAAIGEELFFRAWIQDTAEQLNLTPAVGLAVSCVAFAFIHLWQGLYVMIYSAFIGLLYSLWYHRKHSLWVPVISHGLHNTLVFLLAFRS